MDGWEAGGRECTDRWATAPLNESTRCIGPWKRCGGLYARAPSTPAAHTETISSSFQKFTVNSQKIRKQINVAENKPDLPLPPPKKKKKQTPFFENDPCENKPNVKWSSFRANELAAVSLKQNVFRLTNDTIVKG